MKPGTIMNDYDIGFFDVHTFSGVVHLKKQNEMQKHRQYV